MSIPRMTVLVVGATGSIGRLVVEEAARQGHAVTRRNEGQDAVGILPLVTGAIAEDEMP